MPDPEAPSTTGPRRFLERLRPARARTSGPWRIAVVEGSMRPAIESGDWLLVDPTVARWPRRGSTVVFNEPGTGGLAIKRVAARPGDWVPFADGWLQLGDDEAWLVGDATDEALQETGSGPAIDSRTYGPVPLAALVARAWFRYWPGRRIGRLAGPPPDLLERARLGRIPVGAEATDERARDLDHDAAGHDHAPAAVEARPDVR